MVTLTRFSPRQAGRLLAAAAVGLAVPGTGRAFFFDFGPGSGIPPTQTLVPLAQSASLKPTSGKPPDDWHPPPLPPKPPPPDHAPEPATGLAGLIGLGVIGLTRRWRRRPQ